VAPRARLGRQLRDGRCAQVDFDPDTLTLTIASRQPLPQVRVVNQIDIDILGSRTSTTRVAGPVADPGAKRTWTIDPRSRSGVTPE
jgi:hypothetical protein